MYMFMYVYMCVYIYIYRGAKKCIHILIDVIYVLLFEVELNCVVAMCSRTFA
jgi:hypothetical protein